MTVTPVPPRSNPLIPAIIGFVVVVALAGGVAVAAYIGFQLFQRGTEIPAMLDADTHMYLTFTPNLQDVPNIERLNEAFPSLLGEEENVEDDELSPMDEFLTETLSVRFEEDIQSWIGTEIGVAATFSEEFMDGFGAMSPADSPDLAELEDLGEFYLVMQSRDEAALNAFIEKVRARFEEDGETLTETDHNGMTIYSFEAEGNEMGFAVVKNHLVLTNNVDGIALMADRPEEQSLSASASYRRVKEHIPDAAIGYAFYSEAFYREFWGALTESSPASANIPAFQVAQESMEALEGIAITLTVEENGLRFETISAMNFDSLSEEARHQVEISQEAVGQEMAMLVGANALVMMNARLPENFGEQMMQGFAATPEVMESIESFESDTGINLEEDVLSWLSGDLLLTVLSGDNEMLPMSGYVRLRTNNLDAAKTGINKIIDALLQGAPESPFEEQTIEGVEWTVLPDPSGTEDPFLGYAFVESDVVIAAGAPAINQTGERGDALVESDIYRAATQGLPENNTGIFYINIQEIVSMVDEMSPGMIDSEMKENLAPFVAAAAAREAGMPENGITRGEFFIYIVAPTAD